MTEFHLTYTLILMLVVFAAVMGTVAYLTFGERKISAYVQDRVGPNRVGPWGLFQVIADGLKFFLKEDIIPSHVDKLFYFLAPGVGVATALLAFSIVPFGPSAPPPGPVPVPVGLPDAQAVQAAAAEHDRQMAEYHSQTTFAVAPGLDIGILFAFAIGSLVVYGIILGGWSSNSKYSLLGSLRSSAQIISYEIPLGMSVLGLFLFVGSVNLEKILDYQTHHGWFILYQPLAFLLFMVSVYAECNRLPFDLPEAEQELVGGFHTEYGAMKLGLMLMVDYIHMITTSFFMAILFFGGWHFPGLSGIEGTWGIVVKFVVLGVKVFFFLMLYYLVRWTIPRFKFDQLMALAWQVMIPLAIINLVCVTVVREFNISPWFLTATSVLTFVTAAVIATRERSTVISRPREPVAASEGV
jgi:NADH-quinone oxidoreductase subunit H